MKPIQNPEDHADRPARITQWLASKPCQWLLLGVAVYLSWPAFLAERPEIGLDPSWHLTLQLAAIQGKVFGREFIFTYGPLGYLLIHAAVNKTLLLLCDIFIIASLLSIYRALLALRPTSLNVFLLIGLAVVTKICWWANPSAILFTILCYWLWRVYDRGDWMSTAAGGMAALVLFFGKVNYGLIVGLLVPAYGICLLTLHKNRKVHGLLLLFGFPVLVQLGGLALHVDMPKYLRSGIELIAGYNEAMYAYSRNPYWQLGPAALLLLFMGGLLVWGGRRFPWREQVILLPLIGLATLLLFKNAFTRSDELHNPSFYMAFPLLLTVWYIGWRGAMPVRFLLLASLCTSLALLTTPTAVGGFTQSVSGTPLDYGHQLTTLPWHEDASHLQTNLRSRFPEATLPTKIRSTIGQSSVDVMPWESSLAVLNGLNYQPRPISQSYSAYTPWLDNLNVRFLTSTNAPDFILYACAQAMAIDGRPAAWDESLTKMALMENYALDSEFQLPMCVWANQSLAPANVFLLKRIPRLRHWVPIATNTVSLALGESLPIPNTTNLVFLTLKVNRTILGKLASAALSPEMLIACFEYQDGSPGYYQAVLPILQTGVLINRRVESTAEIRNWLNTATTRNMSATSISFKTHGAWAFQTPLNGFLIEYRLEDN
jgi:hypothetical protein